MTDAARRIRIPELSPTARGLCGVYFAVGAHSTLRGAAIPLDHAAAIQELLRHGVVQPAAGRDAYRGTHLSVLIGDGAMDRADALHRREVASPA